MPKKVCILQTTYFLSLEEFMSYATTSLTTSSPQQLKTIFVTM